MLFYRGLKKNTDGYSTVWGRIMATHGDLNSSHFKTQLKKKKTTQFFGHTGHMASAQ